MSERGDYEHFFFEQARSGADFQAHSASAPASESKERNPSQATKLLGLVEGSGALFFHTPDQRPFATISMDGHFETWSVRSGSFRRWLAGQFFLKYGKACSSQALRDALEVIAAKAQFQGREDEVFVRVAEHRGHIYLDLANPGWQAVKISPEGWSVVDDYPVRFRRSQGQLPLPDPARHGRIQDLRRFVNLKDDRAWVLFLSWLVAALRPRGPYPILACHGEQGSAKTTLGRIARALVDPWKAGLRTTPRNERDLMIAANRSHIVGFDNLSYLPSWLSDALCRLSTGGGLGTRELFTDEDEVIFDSQRPVVLNGIGEIAARGDLLDRMVILHLTLILDDERREEKEFWTDFELARPLMLGALLDAVSVALRKLPSVHLKSPPRMADFAVWATAAEEALGFNEGAFMSAYRSNRAEAHQVALESSPVAAEICTLMGTKDEVLETTTNQLLNELNAVAGEELLKRRPWPKTAKALSSALDRLAPDLRAVGLHVIRLGREPGTGRRLWRVEKVKEGNSQSSQASQVSENQEPEYSPGFPPSSQGNSQPSSPATYRKDGPISGCEGCEDRERPVEGGGGELPFEGEI